jgi:hypothetical protein
MSAIKHSFAQIRVIRGKLSPFSIHFLQEAGKKTLERTNLVPLLRRVGVACLFASSYRDAIKHSNGQIHTGRDIRPHKPLTRHNKPFIAIPQITNRSRYLKQTSCESPIFGFAILSVKENSLKTASSSFTYSAQSP